MARPPGFFDIDERLTALSAKGDALEKVERLVDFERFRPLFERAVPLPITPGETLPPFSHALTFKALILQISYSLSDERTEHLNKDLLSFTRFLGLTQADPVPDLLDKANTSCWWQALTVGVNVEPRRPSA